ncbi:MAG TPA: hypothetical protein VFS32_13935 [Candidatus Limnocylindrales bacterium]|nr:hypothetical protein [Candidatus Limnocylindrales bacterium]
MNDLPELVALVQRDRERHIERMRLARLASRARACSPSAIDRLVRLVRPAPAGC